MANIKELYTKMVDGGIDESAAKKITGYIDGAIKSEASKDDPKKRPVTNNSDDILYALSKKYYLLGLVLDGVNVVITGRNMGMVTYHGYKNKVLSVYPETKFDIQLVREADMFSVSKSSGHIEYTHEIGDPFGNSPIVGAYVIFKNKRGEYLETLSKSDYEKMKHASKQSYLWGEWESEFWLKSVIKRACKRHFNDIIAEIDKNDNEDYGFIDSDPAEAQANKKAAEEKSIADAITAVEQSKSNDELNRVFMKYKTAFKHLDVVAAAKEKRAELTGNTKPTEKPSEKKQFPDLEAEHEKSKNTPADDVADEDIPDADN